MSNKEEIQTETLETQEVAAEQETPAPQITIQIDDIIKAFNLIEVALERSTFKPRELLEVMPVYEKLLAFAQQVQEAQSKGE